MIYTDGVHMAADTLDELHAFAEKIGLGRHYFEGTRKGHPHYDLVKRNSKARAYEEGALYVASKILLSISKFMLPQPATPYRPFHLAFKRSAVARASHLLFEDYKDERPHLEKIYFYLGLQGYFSSLAGHDPNGVAGYAVEYIPLQKTAAP